MVAMILCLEDYATHKHWTRMFYYSGCYGLKKLKGKTVPEDIVTSESRPVKILVELEAIFKNSLMDSYAQWMNNVKVIILGKSDAEAAKAIISCYAGVGSLMDMGLDNERFYQLIDELYDWAAAVPNK